MIQVTVAERIIKHNASHWAARCVTIVLITLIVPVIYSVNNCEIHFKFSGNLSHWMNFINKLS